MKTAVQQLSQYARYHRDQRNILTHFIGVPMIVFAVMVFLSRPALTIAGVPIPVSLAVIATAVTVLYYIKLDLSLGAVMAVVFVVMLKPSADISSGSTLAWLLIGASFFLTGWTIQFIGHYFEGKKPAFVEDIVGLIIGPFFIAAELAFILGARKDLQIVIEKEVGPVYFAKST